jgi:RNA polymerase sigma factor (sigma-70 family)
MYTTNLNCELFFEKYMPLIKKILWTYKINDEDVKQDIYLKFCEYCDKYKETQGISFGYYMKVMLRFYVQNKVVYKKVQPATIPLDMIEIYWDSSSSHEESINTLEDLIESKKVHNTLKLLTPKQRRVLEMLVLGDLCDTEVAKELNISKQALYKIKQLIKIKIQKHM